MSDQAGRSSGPSGEGGYAPAAFWPDRGAGLAPPATAARMAAAARALRGAVTGEQASVLNPGFGRLPREVAEAELRRVDAAGAQNLWFAWAGGTAPGERHYYRVQGPGLLIEHDNTQSGANHVHSVWRVPGGDFGDDLLAAHYRAEAH
jgi:Protein of unknown function (DUF3500)